MDDLISRQAAYDTLTEYYHHRTDAQHEALRDALNRVPAAQQEKTILTVKCELDDEELRRAIEDVKNAELELIAAQQGQQWIPVSERLPETDGYYLVTIKTFGWNGEQYEDVDIARYERKNGWLKADKCTAWTPLPKPYYGGES